MPYVLVFEITRKPLQFWVFLLLFLIFTLIGTVVTLMAREHGSRAGTKAVRYSLLLIASLWIFSFSYAFFGRRRYVQAYRSGNYAVVEGPVEDLYQDSKMECFSVRHVRFCYGDAVIQPGFNQTASHGGPIREGLPVRVTYYDGQILRMDIAASSIR